jgi:threonine/homoserine/homoserine lactone efflux protein
MTRLDILSLLLAILVLAISPGPGLFAVISKSLSSGFKNGSFMVLGLILGDIIYLLMAIYGLNAIAYFMGDFFILIKYIGGMYLLHLGYKIIISSIQNVNLDSKEELSFINNFLTGLLITLSNPKVIIFYLGFLPVFINLEVLHTLDVIISIIVVASTLLVVMLSYAYLASKSKELFQSKKAMKKLNYISGSVMITAGSFLIFKN